MKYYFNKSELHEVSAMKFRSGAKYYEAIRHIKINPYSTITSLTKYLKEYPLDFTAQIDIVNLYILLNNFEKAKEILAEVKPKYMKIKSQIYKDVVPLIDKNFLSAEIKIALHENRYEEALKLSNKFYALKKRTDKIETRNSDYNLSTLLYYLSGFSKKTDSYFSNQLYDYSIARLKDHIEEKHTNESAECSNFNEDVNIDKLINEVIKYIPSEKGYFTGLATQKYIFKYSNIGTNNNVKTDYFTVVVAYGTNKIITMHPISSLGEYEYIDLNYLKHENNHNNKQLSQIDKFNKRLEKTNMKKNK